MEEFLGVGRRKRAVASVRLRQGKGKIAINGREFTEYFSTEMQRHIVLAPFTKLALLEQYDAVITLKGGGIESQAIACRLGLSRALVRQDEERRPSLKAEGFLTRDPRKKERKKYGLAKARKAFQFSKR